MKDLQTKKETKYYVEPVQEVVSTPYDFMSYDDIFGTWEKRVTFEENDKSEEDQQNFTWLRRKREV